jgi:hypothetical protein
MRGRGGWKGERQTRTPSRRHAGRAVTAGQSSVVSRFTEASGPGHVRSRKNVKRYEELLAACPTAHGRVTSVIDSSNLRPIRRG